MLPQVFMIDAEVIKPLPTGRKTSRVMALAMRNEERRPGKRPKAATATLEIALKDQQIMDDLQIIRRASGGAHSNQKYPRGSGRY